MLDDVTPNSPHCMGAKEDLPMLIVPEITLMFLVHRRDILRWWKLFADRNTVPLPLAGIVKKFEGFFRWLLRMRVSGARPAQKVTYGLLHCAGLLGARSHS